MRVKSLILEGSDFDEIIRQGLKKLGKKRDEVEIEILQKGVRLVGISLKNYKVKMSVKVKENKATSESEVLEKVKKEELSELFEIQYKEDGVYVKLNKIVDVELDEKLIERILIEVKRRNIENYDEEKIKQIPSLKTKEAVCIAEKQEEKPKDSYIEVKIAEDKMTAHMRLLPAEGGRELDIEELKSILDEKIKHGMMENNLIKAVRQKVYNRDIPIAKGRKVRNGIDAILKYKYTSEKNHKPSITDDGVADYRNIHLINCISEGDIIAEKIPSVKGVDGIDVYGNQIEAKKGEDKEFKIGKNVKLSDDGLAVIAEKSGQIQEDNGKISIIEMYQVSGNVDNSTGNIEFEGSVIIKGGVKSGFTVKAAGDIEIYGVVEEATVETNQSVIIKSGMHGGDNGELRAGGDVTSKYLMNCHVIAKGDVHSEVIMHSHIESENAIIVEGKKGSIVGGICKAKKEVKAKSIGSEVETTTIIEVGADPKIKARHDDLKVIIKNKKDNIKKNEKSVSVLERKKSNSGLSGKQQGMLREIVENNKKIEEELELLEREYEELEKEMENSGRGKVKVWDEVYPGVKIVMGNDVMFVRDTLKHCTIFRKTGEIEIGPYED